MGHSINKVNCALAVDDRNVRFILATFTKISTVISSFMFQKTVNMTSAPHIFSFLTQNQCVSILSAVFFFLFFRLIEANLCLLITVNNRI